ncbi:MAG: tetratricopeptide (TPR) repeat protein [Glaciecola sp.]|jgi:tetratricopeptide (TPR) repeat protein
MRLKISLVAIIFGLFFIPQTNYAQVDFNKTPDDDLGNIEDKYQEYFFEALKQKGIENYDRSIKAFLKCVELDDSQSVVYFELGKNYIQLKNFGAAEDVLKKAISKDPDNEWYLNELYGVYEQTNDFDNTLKTIKLLVRFHPDYQENLANLYSKNNKFRQALKILDDMDKEYGYAKSRDYLRNQIYDANGDDKDRIENLEERITNNPKDEQNYLKLIYRYSEQNDRKNAFNTAQKLLENLPSSHLVHLALYKFYLEDNETERAINSMGIVLKSDTVNPEAKAKVLNDFVKFAQDNPQYEARLLEITADVTDDETGKSSAEMAQYYLQKGDKQKALSHFKIALQRDADDFDTIKKVLLLQIDLDMFSDAVVLSNQALEMFPSQPILYLANGVANNNLQKYKEAIESLEIGIDYVIDNVIMEIDFYKQLSTAYKYLNNIQKSQSFAKKAEALINGQ